MTKLNQKLIKTFKEMESMKLHIESLESEKGVPSVFGGGAEHIGAGGVAGEVAQLKEKIRREQQLVLQLEMDLQVNILSSYYVN